MCLEVIRDCMMHKFHVIATYNISWFRCTARPLAADGGDGLCMRSVEAHV